MEVERLEGERRRRGGGRRQQGWGGRRGKREGEKEREVGKGEETDAMCRFGSGKTDWNEAEEGRDGKCGRTQVLGGQCTEGSGRDCVNAGRRSGELAARHRWST